MRDCWNCGSPNIVGGAIPSDDAKAKWIYKLDKVWVCLVCAMNIAKTGTLLFFATDTPSFCLDADAQLAVVMAR